MGQCRGAVLNGEPGIASSCLRPELPLPLIGFLLLFERNIRGVGAYIVRCQVTGN